MLRVGPSRVGVGGGGGGGGGFKEEDGTYCECLS